MSKVLDLFSELSIIPHGSFDVKKISDYLADWAKDHKFEVNQDDSFNIVINKPATLGFEKAKRIIMQAHMDMVCEKEDGFEFDFNSDSLILETEGDYIYAKGTTLGGDDLSGVAMALCILEDDNIKHGPLTAIFTVNEEVGMLGAISLDKKYVEGDCYLLNLDSEEEGHFLTSCAGGICTTGYYSYETVTKKGNEINIEIKNLSGGHSGEMIHKGSANAIILLFELLDYMNSRVEFDLISCDGGLKDNAIPRGSIAKILSNDDFSKIKSVVDEFSALFKEKYKLTDPLLDITMESLGEKENAIIADKNQIIEYFTNVPNGVVSMSSEDSSMVETSLNAGILKTEDGKISIVHSLRSSVVDKKAKLLNEVNTLMKNCGFSFETSGEYPAWEYKKDSKLRETVVSVCQKEGMDYVFEGIHAGLECGVFYEANPSLDIISFGPDIFEIHTPNEKMSISSLDRCYGFLCKLVDELSK